MNLSNFLNILYKYYGHVIERDSDTNRHNNLAKVTEILNWFTDDNYEFLSDNIDFAGKIYRGSEKLPKKHAMAIRSRVSHDKFRDFTDDNELTFEQLDAMIDEFKTFDPSINDNNFADKISGFLLDILNDLIEAPLARPVHKCNIQGGFVYIGDKKIKLPNDLVPPTDIDPVEDNYITALLEVYADHSSEKILTVEDLDNMDPVYKEHINVQREHFFKAQSVLHKIRDTNIFTDGQKEFNSLLDEIYGSIIDELIATYPSPFDKVIAVVSFAGNVNLTKSFLATPGTGIVGPSEKKGFVHVLVNNGKVLWIRRYDATI